MYNNHPSVAVDSYQLAYEHFKQPQFAPHLGESAEVPLYKLEPENLQISEEEDFKATSVADMDSNKQTEALENGKRSSDFCAELMNKRAKKEDQEVKLGQLEGTSPVTITYEEKHFLEATDWKIAATKMIEVDIRQGQPVGVSFFPGFEYHLEDVLSPLRENSHRRFVPIGVAHQADLPPVIDSDEFGADKWLGTCVIPMPMETQLCCSEEDCDCTDEGSIRCVRQHVKEAREKLRETLGKTKFIELGFHDMGEDVAQRWSEEEENLFHMIVLSNSASLGRNFWNVLPRNFPHRSFKEIVSYYFNVFMLRKRADQNRMDPCNADSDNDEWQESSDGEFETSEEDEDDDEEEEEEEYCVVESPADDDASQETDFEERFYGGSGGPTGYEPMTPCKQAVDGNSGDCSLDQDVQDEACTSFEGQKDQENLRMVGLADYDEYIDGHHDSKPWEISYIGATDKDFEFFPTCNVLEEVFGKGI